MNLHCNVLTLSEYTGDMSCILNASLSYCGYFLLYIGFKRLPVVCRFSGSKVIVIPNKQPLPYGHSKDIPATEPLSNHARSAWRVIPMGPTRNQRTELWDTAHYGVPCHPPSWKWQTTYGAMCGKGWSEAC